MKNILLASMALISFNAFATIDLDGAAASNLWKSIDVISKIEGIDLIKTEGNTQKISIDNISCVFEDYNACSFFTEVNGQRKMVVAMDGTAKFMQALVDGGVELDEEYARLDVTSINCDKNATETVCQIEEYR